MDQSWGKEHGLFPSCVRSFIVFDGKFPGERPRSGKPGHGTKDAAQVRSHICMELQVVWAAHSWQELKSPEFLQAVHLPMPRVNLPIWKEQKKDWQE